MFYLLLQSPATPLRGVKLNSMDVLRKELNDIYSNQHLDCENLDKGILERCKAMISTSVLLSNSCNVITDASADFCYIHAGYFAKLLGLTVNDSLCGEFYSSDEDIIYNRIHPEDLVEKRMLEYEFFKFADKLNSSEKIRYKATCRIRIKNYRNEYIYVYNTTQILRLSPNGKIWLILCCYDLSPLQHISPDISPKIINNKTGEIISLSLTEMRRQILTAREKEILNLIKEGKPSKQIADLLNISIHTVNRHRQNILGKLSVGNSLEAVMAAAAMKLL